MQNARDFRRRNLRIPGVKEQRQRYATNIGALVVRLSDKPLYRIVEEPFVCRVPAQPSEHAKEAVR